MKKKRHNFNNGISLHKVCGNYDLRPIMSYIYFDNGYAIASDGHILIKADINDISNFTDEEIELLNGKLLHSNQFKQIVKADEVTIEETGITAKYEYFEIKYLFHILKDEKDRLIKYPNYQKIFDGFKKNSLSSIGVNSRYLETLCSSVNACKAKLSFNNCCNGILVNFPFTEMYNTIGLIMPLNIDE